MDSLLREVFFETLISFQKYEKNTSSYPPWDTLKPISPRNVAVPSPKIVINLPTTYEKLLC